MAEQEAASEWVRLNGELVAVPAAICEERSVFDAAVSLDTWNSLSEEHKEHLKTFLPSFSGGDDAARDREETLRQLLGADGAPPLQQLAGCPRDRLFSMLHEGQLTEEIHALRRLTAETRTRDAKVWLQTHQDGLLRELLLKRKQLLDAAVRTPADTPVTLPPARKKSRRAVLEQRARKRYFQELEQACAEAGCGDQELSPDDNYPEGAPPPLTRKQQRRLSKLEASLGAEHVPLTATASRRHQRGLHLADHVTHGHNPFEVSEARFAQLLMKHRKRRAKGQVPAASASVARDPRQLQSLLKRSPPSHSSDSDSDAGGGGGDRPDPVAPAAAGGEAAVWEAAALGHQTHSSFFSLLRDVLCSDPADRLPAAQLHRAVRAWQQSPISALNEWYQQQGSWVEALPSALAFLSGEVPELQTQINMVPFLDHNRETGVYQWIGAGRDSDIHLESLCAYWRHRKDTIRAPAEPAVVESLAKLPPPLHPTSWTVQPSTPAEKDEYRRQERQRYQQPRRAFTYHLHGYRSVVGPVRGGHRDWRTARGHALLAPDRPPAVTLLSLVRDAVARLPNGQGTRAELLLLVRDSGYLAADAALAGAVSSALDRLHAEADPCVRYDAHRKLWIYLHRHRSESDFETIYRQRQGGAPRGRRTAVRRSTVPAPGPAPSPGPAIAPATSGVSLLKPRSAVAVPVRPEPAAAAVQERPPGLSQTELAVQSILPLEVADSPQPPPSSQSPAPARSLAPAAAAAPPQTPLHSGPVKMMKNQHAIVHIPSKTPGAAPQLALFANGKLIPIVNQPQTVKSGPRPAAVTAAATSSLLCAARPLLAAGAQLVATRPAAAATGAAAAAATPVVLAGTAVSSAAATARRTVPSVSTVAATARRTVPLSNAAPAAPQLVQVSGSAAPPRLQPVASTSIRLTTVRAPGPARTSAAPLRQVAAPAAVSLLASVQPVGSARLPAAPTSCAPGRQPPVLSVTSPRLAVVSSVVGSPRVTAAQSAPPPRLAGVPTVLASPRLAPVQPGAASPRLTSVQTLLPTAQPGSPRLSSAPSAAGAAARLTTVVQTSAAGQRVSAAAAGAGPSQLKHITIPVSQLSRLLQQQGAVSAAGGPLTLAQIGGKQVLIAARPAAAAAGASGAATKQPAQVVLQGAVGAAAAQVRAAAAPASAAVQLGATVPPSVQPNTAGSRPAGAARAVVLSSGAAAPVLLPALKGLQGYKLVQLPAAPAAAARVEAATTKPAESTAAAAQLTAATVALSIPSVAPQSNHVQLQPAKAPEGGRA